MQPQHIIQKSPPSDVAKKKIVYRAEMVNGPTIPPNQNP